MSDCDPTDVSRCCLLTRPLHCVSDLVGRECITKFGKVTGPEVWEAVNDCFDAMPLAAVIDNKVRGGQHHMGFSRDYQRLENLTQT